MVPSCHVCQWNVDIIQKMPHLAYVTSSLYYVHLCQEVIAELLWPMSWFGHSSWLEASHSVFIRFRSKHIHLERLHYETATNLGLLQSNMTYMWSKHGPGSRAVQASRAAGFIYLKKTEVAKR